MMEIARFRHGRAAAAFVDYLRAHRLELQVEQEPLPNGGMEYVVFLLTPGEKARAFAEASLQEFLANPADKKFLDASWQVGDDVGARQALSKYYRWNSASALAGLKETRWVNALVLLVIYGVFLFTWLTGNPAIYNAWSYFSQLSGAELGQEFWRFVTPAFLHGNIPHLVFNSLWWWVFVRIIELRQGSWRVVSLLLLTAAISNTAQFYVLGKNNFGGLSGVIYGLLGYLWVYGKVRPAFGQLNPVLVRFMLVWMLICFTGIVGPVANTAHVTGLLAGCFLGWFYGKTDR